MAALTRAADVEVRPHARQGVPEPSFRQAELPSALGEEGVNEHCDDFPRGKAFEQLLDRLGQGVAPGRVGVGDGVGGGGTGVGVSVALRVSELDKRRMVVSTLCRNK